MKRAAFEQLLEQALKDMATAQSAPLAGKPARRDGLGGIQYGVAEREVGKLADKLNGRLRKPMPLLDSDFLPPCF